MEAEPVNLKTLVFSLLAALPLEAALRWTSLGSSITGLGTTRLVQTALLLWVVSASPGGTASIGLKRATWLTGASRGLIWSVGFGAAVLSAFFVFYLSGINLLPMIRSPLPQDVKTIVLFFVVGGVIAPVAEEIFFRGLIYGFVRRWGVASALVISTVMFVFSHPFNHGFLAAPAVGGLVFAVSYEVERSLFVPITIHILGNLAIFALSVLFQNAVVLW